MPLPTTATTVTPLSKFIAIFLFVFLPFVGFFLGMKYGQGLQPGATSLSCPQLTNASSCASQKGCSEEAKQCPDGSFVFRQSPSCDFAPCPSPTSATPAANSNQLLLLTKSKEEQIALQLAAQTKVQQKDLVIAYQQQPEKEATLYAGGRYNSKNGGGWWLAAKINGVWKVTSIGNGTPKCSDVDPYYYPNALVPSCTNAKNEIIAR